MSIVPKLKTSIRTIELFAGVGGFRLGLERASRGTKSGNEFTVVWSNQWEPPGTATKQFAHRCYTANFDPEGNNSHTHSNEDIAAVLDSIESGQRDLPPADLLVGGFPCQDYSVAKPLSQAEGIHGKKGVLWWEIYRLLELAGDQRPKMLLLENVDRMLKSPASQRGRDFAVMMSCLNKLGYRVEWRVVNAADYGEAQRRRRVFIYAELENGHNEWDMQSHLMSSGVLAAALPIENNKTDFRTFDLPCDPYEASENFGLNAKKSAFLNAGVMQNGTILTCDVAPKKEAPTPLRKVLVPDSAVPDEYYINDTQQLEKWKYYKGSKKESRIDKKTGYEYTYAEGSMPFPDPLDTPARTILTGEGGASASRFKHIISTADGRYRRLVPEELEQINGFPPGWTDHGLSPIQRAFCMGNALVVGIVERIGLEILKRS